MASGPAGAAREGEALGAAAGQWAGMLGGLELGFRLLPVPFLGHVAGAVAGAVAGSEVGRRVGRALGAATGAFVESLSGPLPVVIEATGRLVAKPPEAIEPG